MAKTLAELKAEMLSKMQSESGKSQGSGKLPGDWATLVDGDNFIRFLPGKNSPLEFFVEGTVHKYQDEKGFWRSYKCRKTAGEKCPVCEYYFDLWKRHKALNLGKDSEGNNIKSKFGDLAMKIKPKNRYYATAIVRSIEEAGEYPVKYVAMSQQLFDRVMGALLNEDYQDEDDPENSTIIDLERGNDFNIRITRQGQFPSFVESAPRLKKTRAGAPAQVAEWMDNKLNLQSLVEVDSYEKGNEIIMHLETTLNPVRTETTPSDGDASDTPPWSDDAKDGGLKV